jgi:hypothetical protein
VTENPTKNQITDSLHTVWENGGFLGLVCKGCDHRAVVDRSAMPIIRWNNMTSLRSLTFRCGSCGASGKGPEHWTMFMPMDAEQASDSSTDMMTCSARIFERCGRFVILPSTRRSPERGNA